MFLSQPTKFSSSHPRRVSRTEPRVRNSACSVSFLTMMDTFAHAEVIVSAHGSGKPPSRILAIYHRQFPEVHTCCGCAVLCRRHDECGICKARYLCPRTDACAR